MFWDNETGEISVNWLNGDLPPGIGTLLYDAPPAQAVDLGQFRVAVLQSLLRCDDERQRGFISAEDYEAWEAEHQRLLALIDCQAVGK